MLRVFVWDWAAKKEVRRFVQGRIGSSSHSLAFSPDGKMLAAPLDGVTVWDMAQAKYCIILTGAMEDQTGLFDLNSLQMATSWPSATLERFTFASRLPAK